MLILGYGFLLQKNRLPFDNSLLAFLIQLHLISGIAYILIFFIHVVSIRKFFIFAILLSISLMIFFLLIHVINQDLTQQDKVPVKNKGSQLILTLATARQFYLDLFFDVFGYPPDDRMSTKEELFDAVNQYRVARGMDALREHPSLCGIAQADFQQLYAFYSNRTVQIVRRSSQKGEITEIGEIINAGLQPNEGQHIVNAKWARSFSSQKTLLEDPQWQFGCAAVSEFNVTFIFGKY